jgi:hypothetical protein
MYYVWGQCQRLWLRSGILLQQWLELLPESLRLTQENLGAYLSQLNGGAGAAAWAFTFMHSLAETAVLALHEVCPDPCHLCQWLTYLPALAVRRCWDGNERVQDPCVARAEGPRKLDDDTWCHGSAGKG